MRVLGEIAVMLDKDEVAAMLCQGVAAKLKKQGIELEVAKGHAVDPGGGTLAATVTLTAAALTTGKAEDAK